MIFNQNTDVLIEQSLSSNKCIFILPTCIFCALLVISLRFYNNFGTFQNNVQAKKKKKKTVLCLYFVIEEWLRSCCMNIPFLFCRTHSRTNKMQHSRWPSARTYRNIIWPSSCKLWLINDRCWRARGRERNAARTRHKILIGSLFSSYFCR